jgi:non-specific serine/threonine protein kinase/serine/threonine-protein kinase
MLPAIRSKLADAVELLSDLGALLDRGDAAELPPLRESSWKIGDRSAMMVGSGKLIPMKDTARRGGACGLPYSATWKRDLTMPGEMPPSDLTPSFVPQGTAPAPGEETLGGRVGPYRLLQLLGQGGMGSVYLAQQDQPVQRRVALKVIKAGLDSSQVLARFEAERQALALMDHPNIARVIDAGATESGRPYFVMELVKGLPITRFCDQEHLSPRERLELFAPVCQAVQHAHQKGIIHRDLKPSNVLVALYDGKPVPKVIDFGVAKAITHKLTDHTLYTEIGQIVGTLEYMAPEQAEVNNLDIDTRADVYSLGVILYELLTGSPPFTAMQLRGIAYAEMRRVLREVEPPRPSTRLSSSEALPAIAAARRLEPAKLTKLVRGDLDWIVMKCLEKDRSRRYETANALALEVQRYLHDEPVMAGPPSAAYRLTKFVRRNRGPVLATALVLLTLVVGVVVSTWQAMRAIAAEAQALEDRDAKEQARLDQAREAAAARAATVTAEQRLVRIEKGIEILTAIFRDLDPESEEIGGPPLRVQMGKQLEQAAKQLDGEAAGDPLTVARLQDLLGASQRSLGNLAQSQELLERAHATRQALLGPDHIETLQTKQHLASLYQDQGKYDQAASLYRDVIAGRTAKLGADHADTLDARNDLGTLLQDQGKYDQALRLHQQVLDRRIATLGPGHRQTQTSKNNLAAAYKSLREYDKAEPLYEAVLANRTATLGPDHPLTLTIKNNLASLYQNSRKKYDQAESLFQEVIAVRTAKLGPDHRLTLATKSNLAILYQAQRKLDQARPLFQSVLDASVVKFGPDHPDTLMAKHDLAIFLQAQGQFDRAEPLLRDAVDGMRKHGGIDHPFTRKAMFYLIDGYQEMKQPEKADPLLRELAEYWRRKAGPDSAEYAGQLTVLGMNLLGQRKGADAEPVLRESLNIRTKTQPDAWSTFNTRSLLGGAMVLQNKYSAAEPLLLQAWQGMRDRQAQIPMQVRSRRLMEAVQRLVELYDAWGKADQATRWRKELAAISQAGR